MSISRARRLKVKSVYQVNVKASLDVERFLTSVQSAKQSKNEKRDENIPVLLGLKRVDEEENPHPDSMHYLYHLRYQ
jgi:uncharacterized membrane protein